LILGKKGLGRRKEGGRRLKKSFSGEEKKKSEDL